MLVKVAQHAQLPTVSGLKVSAKCKKFQDADSMI